MFDANRPLSENGSITMDAIAMAEVDKYISSHPNATYKEVADSISWYWEDPSVIIVDYINDKLQIIGVE